jgi:hypothetical protein
MKPENSLYRPQSMARRPDLHWRRLISYHAWLPAHLRGRATQIHWSKLNISDLYLFQEDVWGIETVGWL